MPDIFKKSLRNKLLFILIGVGFLPFLTLLVYTLFLSESKIVNKTIEEHLEKTKVVIRLIDSHLNTLGKEVDFLSSLDMMDDLVAEDIDKRISRLLTQKHYDLSLDITFMAINNDSTVVASSKKEFLFTKYGISGLTKDHGTYISNGDLYIYSRINASFDETKKLGFLVLKYNLKNLDLYLTHNRTIDSYIIDPNNNFLIGKKNIPVKIDFKDNKNNIIDNDYVVVYEKLSSFLNGWYIVYAVDRSVAFEFLYDFIRFMLYMSSLIFILIIYMSIKRSKEIVKPIEELTSITDKITKTHNYSAQLAVSSQDEIAILTDSFNKMLKTTSFALNSLEEENRLRLKRFTQLINVFNTIIQTKSEAECIEVSIQELKELTQKENLRFIKERHKTDSEAVELFVTDFEKDVKIYFGSVELGVESYEDKNEQDFYNSIASMITLQLDKIRLIERTTSASKAKSAFISNMSHELRTPLNAIIGFAQYMIEYEELSDDQNETVANIESSAKYLLGMINEILDIAKIEAGKMDVYTQEVDITDIIKSSYTMLLPLAKEKGIKFDLSHENFHGRKYMTDPKMFKQIVINLISNSIKFTDKGSVSLELYNDDKNIYVSVKDSGIGISKEDMKNLFNDFTQVENVMQKSHKGTGLGLSLSRKMAKMLGGDVTLHSDGIGHGSTSLFFIPIASADH